MTRAQEDIIELLEEAHRLAQREGSARLSFLIEAALAEAKNTKPVSQSKGKAH
ncbi:hypothetical protein [Mesorhizobium sp. CAU 1741]|uniref:hypothetical protein n=1 Tax=Mesorhizobium sp. CAU 1741 TaxID=3140366 RepID=UPI00325C05BF